MSGVVSPRRLEREMSAALQAIAAIDHPDDKALVEATVEGQSEVLEILDKLAELAIGTKHLVETARARAMRLEARGDRVRGVMLKILEACSLPSVERAQYTATVSHHAVANVVNEDDLPEAYIRHAPDMRLILKDLTHGETVAGAQLGNPQPRLTLRTA